MAVRDVSGTTRVVVVIGDPIEHTLSPAMHNAGFDALELDWVYIAAHVAPAGVGAAVEAIRALDLSGMNVTVPHKQAVMPFLDELAPDAEAVGAVNTIVNRDGRLIGDNTDVVGIVRAVEGSLGARPWPEHVVVLGAGGAARGVVHAMTTVDAVERVTILNRTAEKADAMADEFDGATRVDGAPLDAAHASRALATAGVVVNVTSLGRGSLADMTPLPDEWRCLKAGIVCVDSNYSPPETELMRQVRRAGGHASNGIEMLLNQGARSFELWTGLTAPIYAMRAALGSA